MKRVALALIILCIAVAFAGCTGFSKNSVTGSANQRAASVEADSWQGLAAEKGGAAYPIPSPVYSPGAAGSGHDETVNSKIIRTAQVTIEVKDVIASADALKDLAIQNGGYLSSSNFQTGYNNRRSATVVLRVPQSSFESVVEGIKKTGTVRSASTQAEDVTEKYIDLQAQKTSYQNQLAQYNVILKKADKVEDIIKVQAQIDQVQTSLDRLEGRIRYLNSRVDLSTITVYLQEPEPVGGETGHSFIAAVNEGISGFFGMIDALIVLCFTLLPIAIIGGAGFWVYRWRKGKAKGTPETAVPQDRADRK